MSEFRKKPFYPFKQYCLFNYLFKEPIQSINELVKGSFLLHMLTSSWKMSSWKNDLHFLSTDFVWHLIVTNAIFNSFISKNYRWG